MYADNIVYPFVFAHCWTLAAARAIAHFKRLVSHRFRIERRFCRVAKPGGSKEKRCEPPNYEPKAQRACKQSAKVR